MKKEPETMSQALFKMPETGIEPVRDLTPAGF